MSDETAYAFLRDKAAEQIAEAIERLIHIEDKLDSFTARQDARYGEIRDRLIHAEERLDHVLERLPQRQARPVAFLHVPKTAGTSFTAGLLEAVKPRCAVGGFDRCLFGAFTDFPSFAPDQRRNVYLGPQEISPFCDMLAGHFSLATIRAWTRDAAVVLVLREPRARLLSHWTFWRGAVARDQRTLGGWHAFVAAAREPLRRFLQAPLVACQTDNVAVRMLLWPHPLIPESDFIAPADDGAVLAAAAARLAELACVNVIENPALSADMAAWLRRPFELHRLKVTAAVPPELRTDLAAELTPEARALLAARTRLDRRLWERVCRWVMPEVDAAVCGAEAAEAAEARYQALLSGG